VSLPSWLRNPRTADITLTLLVGVIVLPGVIASADEEGRSLAIAGVLGLATVLPLLIRRRAPFHCLGLIAVFVVVPPADGAYVLPLMVALYTIGSTRSWETTAAVAGAVLLVGAAYRLAGGAELRNGDFVGLALECALGSLVGLYVGTRRARAAAQREAALADERLRIAQELHDVVAHNVSLIIVQAQALGATAGDERVREATDGIADLGRQAMREMHRTLKLLRGTDDAAELAPQPGLGELPELLERARTAGVGVELAVEGQAAPAGPERRPVGVPDRAGGAHQRRQARRPRAHHGHARLPPRRTRADDRRHRQRQREHGRPGRPRTRRHARARGDVRRHADRRPARRRGLRGARLAPLRRGVVSRLRVVIADDQPMMRAGFKAVLEATGSIEVVAEAGTGEEAVAAAEAHAPDVVLMDIRMPGMDGIEATRRLPRQRVLILTTFGLDEYIIQALRAGASGFLLKDAPTREVVDAVRAVAAGDAVLAPAVTRQLLDQVGRRLPPPVSRSADGLSELTDREQEVLRMLALALSNAEIAAALVVSEPTVKTHVSNLLGKLGLRDRVQAVIYAYESGPHHPWLTRSTSPRSVTTHSCLPTGTIVWGSTRPIATRPVTTPSSGSTRTSS
jgi:DNA-binding NarL/FixJ family response regulator